MNLTNTCPYCGQPVSRGQLDVIRRRIRREEEEKLKAAEAFTRKQLEEKYRQTLEADRQALKKENNNELLKIQASFDRDRQGFQQKVKELERRLDKRPSQDRGDDQEEDLHDVLEKEFPTDRLRRSQKGQPGADIVQEVRHNGEACGRIAYESKNQQTWASSFVGKLKVDTAREGADHAILVSKTFPRGENGLCLVDGVIVVSPHQAVHIARVLRNSLVDLHGQRLSLKDRAGKTAALYEYITSPEFSKALKEVDDLVEEARTLDARERTAHEKTWRDRDRVLSQMKAATTDIDSQVSAILGRKK